jgi:DNA processing protein
VATFPVACVTLPPVPQRHWLQLALTEGLGPILTRRLIDLTGSAEAACSVSARQLAQVEGIGTKKSEAIATALRAAAPEVDAQLQQAAALGVAILCPDDDDAYPVLLRSIPDPPLVLFVKGALEPRDLNGFAIVGSRRCSYYGREQAERFAALLAGAGFTLVSGGARGTDSAAHRGALSHPQGRTIAVLGSGVDVPYPPENKGLFEQIAQRGAILSEYPLGTPPLADNFPRRNRIISGLSRGVLVTEAADRSGALITARQACDDHGRPVFALPGRVDNAMSVGPHKLIRDGATLVTNLDEILEGLGPLPAEAHDVAVHAGAAETSGGGGAGLAPDEPTLFNVTDRQLLILQQLDHEPMNVDRLMELTQFGASTVLKELTFLTLKGRVKRIDGQTFARK